MIILGNKNSKNGYALGKIGQAGIVFYDKGSYSDGWRYLECAASDQSTSIQWGGRGIATSATATAVGAGKANTDAIIAFWSSWRTARILVANGGTWNGSPIDSVDYTGVQTELLAGKIPSYYKWDGAAANNDPTTWTWLSSYAAKVCDDLVLNGKSDWFLPSKDALNSMYTVLKVNGIGGFASAYYWSSSEYSSTSALGQSFYSGGQGSSYKGTTTYVRAVRAF